MNALIIINCLLLTVRTIYSLNSSDTGLTDLWAITPSATPIVQQKAAEDLIGRVFPKIAHNFEVVINSELLKPDNKDKFILESVPNNKIRITGTTGVSVANGFNYYLKKYLNCHISWSGDQLNLNSSVLPIISTPVKVVIQDKLRYYQNVCTLSYSMVWWDFNRWQREIDWMAMRAINFPLAFNGQELIWRKVFQKYGLTLKEIDDYFTGPAFLAWNRMGNIQSWSGPLTEHWHKYQALLQTNILKSMRSIGMIPILPAFAGHVPRNLSRVLPHAKITKLSNWNRFENDSRTSFLEPSDPHFVEIGSAFVTEYESHYGTDHFYNTDLFNEMTPRSNESQYLSDCGKAVYQSLVKSDPKSIWVMQGWLFHDDPLFWHKEQAKALLTSVPQGKLLILDLMSELYPQFTQLDGYYGQPFIWCMLHNFGGNLGMYGAFNHLNKDVFEARTQYQNMIGIGMTPEGISQNDIVYDFMSETTWYTSSVDLNKWVEQYAHRRYGYTNEDIVNGWRLLQNSVYTDPIKVLNHGRYVINHRPTLNGRSVLWYNPFDLYNAFNYLVNASSSPELQNITTFQYDLIDITRQYLQLNFDIIYQNLVISYKNENITDFNINSKLLLTILDDMNDILSANDNFLLGKWITSAKTLGDTEEEKLFNEIQAKNQITIWGPKANIVDYANKHWSGLFSHYYKPRWQLFTQTLHKSMIDKIPFNQNNFNQQLFQEVELKFVNQRMNFTNEASGDPIKLSKDLLVKYKNIFNTQNKTVSYTTGHIQRHTIEMTTNLKINTIRTENIIIGILIDFITRLI